MTRGNESLNLDIESELREKIIKKIRWIYPIVLMESSYCNQHQNSLSRTLQKSLITVPQGIGMAELTLVTIKSLRSEENLNLIQDKALKDAINRAAFLNENGRLNFSLKKRLQLLMIYLMYVYSKDLFILISLPEHLLHRRVIFTIEISSFNKFWKVAFKCRQSVNS